MRSNYVKGSIVGGSLCLILFFQNCAPAGTSHGAPEADIIKQDVQFLSKAMSTLEGDSLLEASQKRRQLLLELSQHSPQDVLNLAVSSDERARMPEAVRDQLEESVEIEGTLQKFYEDYPDGRHVVRHMLQLKGDRRYEVRSSHSNIPEKFLNKRVSVKGLRISRDASSIEADLVIGDSSQSLYLMDGASDQEYAYDIDTVSSTVSKGEQRTLAILVNFEDDPNNKPWSVSFIQDLVFNSVNKYINEASSQQTWLTGHVTGWYTIPLSSTVCDGFGIEKYAKQAAQNSGFVLSNYNRFIYIFPKNACGYTGMGQVGSEIGSAWIHNSAILRTVGHELIHTFGSHHAHAKDCGDAVIGSSCSNQEYGDTVDIMGYSGTVGHLNAVYKERLGWFTSTNQIINVTTSGDYMIVPSSLSSSGPKTLKIYAGTDSATSAAYYYHVEFRQPIGYDSLIQERGVIDVNNIFNGVIIHESRKMGNGSYDSYMLDMTPGSQFVDMKDAALTVGKSFNDPVSGVSITTLSVSSSGALVRIQVGASSAPPPSDTTAPSVSISSPGNGSAVSGTISIAATASDNVSVAKVEFYVGGVLRGTDTTSPYSISFDTKTLSNGSYSVMAKAYDGAGNSANHQISINVNNTTADTTPPSVSITSPSHGAVFDPRTTITIQASATDNVKVARVDFYVNGSLVCSDTTLSYSCSYKLGASKGAIYNITVQAYDSSNNIRVQSISISSSGGSPKGSGK